MYWRCTSLMILLFSIGRTVQLKNTSFPHPCHLDVWITCCLRLSWAAFVLCILKRSWDLLFWEPLSFRTLVQQWLRTARHEHLMSYEAFLPAAGLGPAHQVSRTGAYLIVVFLVDAHRCLGAVPWAGRTSLFTECSWGGQLRGAAAGTFQNTQWRPGFSKWAATGKGSCLD